jgi:hypothetical protein
MGVGMRVGKRRMDEALEQEDFNQTINILHL